MLREIAGVVDILANFLRLIRVNILHQRLVFTRLVLIRQKFLQKRYHKQVSLDIIDLIPYF